jgi:type I restriction enzyme M protein
MPHTVSETIEKLEADLWEAADQLRANSKLSSSEYCMPVLGVIFLRQAANRFEDATRKIEADQAAGRMPKRPLAASDYVRRRALFLPDSARYDTLMQHASSSDLPTRITAAMTAIEDEFEPLRGILPKDYAIFAPKVLEDLLRIFNRDALKSATGDLFGRIYEFFLMKFAMQGAQDNGEFFTPPSLVQTIVNVIEPEHGKVLDPACGSGGMFVQSSHFMERAGLDTARRVTFYGQEKTATTIRLAKMNLAVHGLDGDIRDANTFYQDEHHLVGGCDFVMANPPFNVDMVDAETVSKDTGRLPFGLPGINKDKKVSNGNYLWISYFWSYLNATGRAGFVMSSQASSAGHGEKDVRQKIVETGDVDVMISIRSNFFYTRAVPCELWFFDKSKPAERRDDVLILDARNLYRKVTRKIYDFSPEQLQNLTSIVWLYRGQTERFLGLVKTYLDTVSAECAAIPPALDTFDIPLHALRARFARLCEALPQIEELDPDLAGAFCAAEAELLEAETLYRQDRAALLEGLSAFRAAHEAAPPETNAKQHAARIAFEPLAERVKGLIKQVDQLYKMASRAAEVGTGLAVQEAVAKLYERRPVGREVKLLDEARKAAVEQLKAGAYFHRQVVWLQERFPNAELQPVLGLVKVVSREDIEKADWSLTPGRYVGVAPVEEDEDFDFEQTLRDIHVELADLNDEAGELAMRIEENFAELGI